MMEPTIQNLFDLTGRVALITGGSGFLGNSLSRALAEAGASVVVASRELIRAKAVVDGLPVVGVLCIMPLSWTRWMKRR